MDVLARIDRWARERPEQLAFDGGGRLTYGDLHDAAGRLAARLRALAEDDPTPIVVAGHKEPELIVAFVAAALAERAYVPIDSSLPQARAERIAALAGASLTLTPERVRALLRQPGGGAPLPSWSGPDRGPDAASRPFYVLFTSGSTGAPKGVVITHGNLASFLRWMVDAHAPRPGEVFLNVAPYSFDLSVMDTWVSLASGGTVVALTREQSGSAPARRARLEASGATIWVSTPSFARLCLSDPAFGAGLMPRLRRLLFCGETLPTEVAAELFERFPEAVIWNTYGPTETTVATTSVRVTPELLARFPTVPIGTPMPGSRVVVVDERLRECPTGTQGEIVIAGPNVSPGYFGRRDLTERAFVTFEGQPAYRTGDLGRRRECLLFFEGRADDQVKVNGYRVELGDVEASLRRLPEVREAAVALHNRGGSQAVLAAFVVLVTGAGHGAAERELALRSALTRDLPAYMLPRIVRFVEALPLTPNGKVDRQALLGLLV